MKVDFARPPVVEVSLSTSFSPIVSLTSARLGQLWREEFKDFPHTEDQPYFVPPREHFGDQSHPIAGGGLMFQVVGQPPGAGRVWLLTEDKTELVQLQRDMIGRNWRRADIVAPNTDPSAYPRYDALQPRFVAAFSGLSQFLQRHDLGNLVPTQCEVTYVNQIPIADPLIGPGDLAGLTSFIVESVGASAPTLEAGQFECSWVADNRLRLRASIKPATRVTDLTNVFVVQLTARGAPTAPTLAGVTAVLDESHDWIVAAFRDLMSPALRRIWGERT